MAKLTAKELREKINEYVEAKQWLKASEQKAKTDLIKTFEENLKKLGIKSMSNQDHKIIVETSEPFQIVNTAKIKLDKNLFAQYSMETIRQSVKIVQ